MHNTELYTTNKMENKLTNYDFKKAYDDVVEFNRLADGGENIITHEKMVYQRDVICAEEVNELLEASICLSENGETVESLSNMAGELADNFVVFSYYHYLACKLEDILNAALSVKYNNWIVECIDSTEIEDVVEAKIRENFRKFPLVSEIEDPQKECKAIEEKYNGRYNNVYYIIVVDKDGNQRYVFKEENGKVVKPTNHVKADIESIIRESM